MAAHSNVKAEIRSQQRTWLRKVSELTGESLSELAVNAGMADVTLTRLMNRDDYEGVLSPLNVEKIKRYSKLPGPGEPMPDDLVTGFAEATRFDYRAAAPKLPAFSAMIAAALEGRPNAAPWLLATDALQTLGHLRGDVLITDNAVQPMAGDIVVAQLTDLKTGHVETIFRIIEPPYLVSMANDPATRQPLPIDNNRVIVMGVVTESLRARQR